MGSTRRCSLHLGRLGSTALVAVALLACEPGQQSAKRQDVAHGTARLEGSIVSTVDGEPVMVDEVERMRDETGLTAREVLRRLQDRVLLMREAEARGLEGGRDGRQAARKAAVQAFLFDEIESQPVSEEELQRAYEAQRATRFEYGERRTSVHILAKLDAGAADAAQRARARALAVRAIALLSREQDVAALRAQVAEWNGPDQAVLLEELPPVQRNGRMVKPFEDALFGLSEPGVVPEPVETRFGFHAVRVTHILPPSLTSFEEARPQIQRELLEAQRERALDRLIHELEQAVPIQRDERVIDLLGQIDL